ncbi:4Fe-4S binding protein [Acetivibrio cellulolyticus]|uniref:4Fe-4S binding protein n=1 Tax=Acetivibrio cellulolyticus TaxID=35830 RepID=UPI0001E2D110|nr:4Fe-4S binding protein [Acetivibrio cellulolyticus]
MNWNKVTKWLRLFVIVGLLVWVTYESYMHQVLGGGKAPSIHALCPFGALESLFTLLFMGSFIKKIYSGTVVLLVLTIAIAVLFRRSFCGLLCPFGALQEVFARIGQKIFKRRFVISPKIDRPLRYLKYLILLLTVGMAWYLGSLWMSAYDPYSAYAHLSAVADTIEEDPAAIVGFILLAITLIASLLYDRFFCKYLCPVGAFYGIIGKISPTKVERNNNVCIHCKACNKACPMNIDVEKAAKVTSAECINCNECVLACPKNGALEIKTAKKTIHPFVMIIIVVGLFFGTILVAQVTGNFEILPSALKEGQTISISEVKGYYSIEEAAMATGMSIEEVYDKLGIPESVSKGTKLKEISKEVPSYDFDAAKEKAGGTDISVKEPETSKAENDSNKVDISGIKGSMTIREAAQSLNMEIGEFYKLFKIPEDVPAQTQMKGISTVSPGYEFEKVKESLR